MIKKIPMRSCVVSKERLPKIQLLRIVRTPSGNVEIDLKGKMNGRGAYIKKDIDVVKQAIRSRVLEKHLEVKIEDNIYENIIKIISQ